MQGMWHAWGRNAYRVLEGKSEGKMPFGRPRQTLELTLTFNRQMGQCCAIKCTSFLNERENTVPQWALKMNNATAAAEIWHLKGHTLNVMVDLK
jgi:hypothetical protein